MHASHATKLDSELRSGRSLASTCQLLQSSRERRTQALIGHVVSNACRRVDAHDRAQARRARCAAASPGFARPRSRLNHMNHQALALSPAASIQPAQLRIAPPCRATTQDPFLINPLDVPKVVAATTMLYKCLLNIASAGCSWRAGATRRSTGAAPPSTCTSYLCSPAAQEPSTRTAWPLTATWTRS